jgi:hypothetical protein
MVLMWREHIAVIILVYTARRGEGEEEEEEEEVQEESNIFAVHPERACGFCVRGRVACIFRVDCNLQLVQTRPGYPVPYHTALY